MSGIGSGVSGGAGLLRSLLKKAPPDHRLKDLPLLPPCACSMTYPRAPSAPMAGCSRQTMRRRRWTTAGAAGGRRRQRQRSAFSAAAGSVDAVLGWIIMSDCHCFCALQHRGRHQVQRRRGAGALEPPALPASVPRCRRCRRRNCCTWLHACEPACASFLSLCSNRERRS